MNTNSLTIKQKAVLGAIKELMRTNGKSPTLEEIRSFMNYNNTSSVQRHITPLIKKGYLKNKENQSRSLELIEEKQEVIDIPLIGNGSCGKPIFAEEDIEAYIPYPKDKTRYPSKDLFFLRATGDSMNEAKINGMSIENGDYVLVHQQSLSDYGKPVVALIGDEATIKIFKKDDEKSAYVLEPKSSNKSHKPILIFEEFAIQGVVIDVVKPNLN